jgi:hypothetical protein
MPTPVRESYTLKANSNKPFRGIDGFKSKAPNAIPSCESLKIKEKRRWIYSKEPERLNFALVYSFNDMTNKIILYGMCFKKLASKNTDII